MVWFVRPLDRKGLSDDYYYYYYYYFHCYCYHYFLLVDDDGCDFTRHLNGTILESFVRPAVLITDAYNALNNQPSRRQRDQEFLGIALSCIIDFLKHCQF